MKEVTLKVQGMTCGHCKMTVERALHNLSGVAKVDVDLAGKTVKVGFNPEKVAEADLKKAIADAGYDVVN
ncbi:MAG: copper chaperone CopZ [Firmicutes bacterium]|nr:copper chaperone CopZ [Bacillota bacterium]